ncbi:DUF6716 putative glycosyltransferase [Brevibacterium litoralis]|uniref:DUF6716 putative glycosyltransferase n=1 Tax=Brevibacterium litoralis TaxID=3138935 RepID=UPI0032EE2615
MTTTHALALVESPLQFLSALEAFASDKRSGAGDGPGFSALEAFGIADDLATLRIAARTDVKGMRRFLDAFPRAWLPEGVTLDTTDAPWTPGPEVDVLYVGDVYSGRIQRTLLDPATARALTRGLRVVLLDDGLATRTAVEVIASGTLPGGLVRERQSVGRARQGASVAALGLLRGLLRRGRLSWVTALPGAEEHGDLFSTHGGTLTHHDFAVTRSFPAAGDGPADRVVIGSAMVADGLVHESAYLAWLDRVLADGPVDYHPHRREDRDLLRRIAARPGVRLRSGGLPVEIALARAPRGTAVYSLPTSATATLPFIMDDATFHVTPVPADWWTGTAPEALRRRLNTAGGASATGTAGETDRDRITVVSVSDSESYLKWACRSLDTLGPDFDIHVLLVDNPILPTREQVRNAVAGSSWEGREIPVVKRSGLAATFARLEPDVVLAAATGPVVQQVYATGARMDRRPGLVSGLPGVGLPATSKGIRYRRLGDVFIAHSEREREAYRDVAARNDVDVEVVVGTLPLLHSAHTPEPAFTAAEVPRRLVFAPQAKVPREKDERMAVLRALAAFARNHPASEVVVKVRSRPGEQETHHEEFSYISLIDEAVRTGEFSPEDLTVAVGPMSDFLTTGSALVTVSSTAALESIDRGLQTMVVTDFGVNEEMLNISFAGAHGMLGTLADLAAGRIGFPERDWLKENYFQERTDEVARTLAALGRRSRAGDLSDLRGAARIQDLRRLRAELRSVSPSGIVRAYRAGRKALGRLRGR